MILNIDMRDIFYMLNTVASYYTDFMVLAKDNPVAAGVLSLYGAGILAFFLRYVPDKIIRFIKVQGTTTIMLKHVADASESRFIQVR